MIDCEDCDRFENCGVKFYSTNSFDMGEHYSPSLACPKTVPIALDWVQEVRGNDNNGYSQ